MGAALSFFPSAALACTCDDARQFTAAQVEEAAAHLAKGDLIVAEVQRLAGVPEQPKRFRVKHTLVGEDLPPTLLLASDVWRVVRTSCDYDLRPGYKGLAVFRRRGASPALPVCSVFAGNSSEGYALAGLCTYGLLDNPTIVRRAVALWKAQAGVSRNKRPPSSKR